MTSVYPWQNKQWDMACNAVNTNSVPQTILLTGESGCGIAEFAVQFAKLILCKNGQLTKSCSDCQSCNLIEKQEHPDLQVIKSDEGRISIDTIRDSISDIHHSSFHGGKRLIIIDTVDSLSISAMNALLKTLEEPPKDLLIVLLSYHRALIPQTIRSRAKEIYFSPIADEMVITYLKEQGYSEDEQNMYSFLSSNHPILAMQLHTDESLVKFENFIELVDQISKQNGQVFKPSEFKNFELLEIIYFMRIVLEDIVRLHVKGLNNDKRNKRYMKFLQTINQELKIDRVYKVLEQLTSLYYENNILNIKSNKDICLNDLFIRLFYKKD